MRKTFLGRTGLAISELAFGGGVTGGILINAAEADQARRAAARGLGRHQLDRHRAIYGDGASEETIGRHLRALTPAASCLHQGPARSRGHARCPGAIERGLEQSLGACSRFASRCFSCTIISATAVGERLALPPEQVLKSGGVADTFDRLKEQGLIRAAA